MLRCSFWLISIWNRNSKDSPPEEKVAHFRLTSSYYLGRGHRCYFLPDSAKEKSKEKHVSGFFGCDAVLITNSLAKRILDEKVQFLNTAYF